jgi:Zn-dependent peptidase ImmA (M78 family)
VDQGPELAELEAERLLRDCSITSFPIDPSKIAENSEISVVPKPTEAGVSGMLIRVGDLFTIAYAAHIASEGFQRFSVAHELGHYFLPGHVDYVLRADGVHHSRAGFLSGDKHEKEADQFAAGLLMPRSLFAPALRSAGDGLDAILELATMCKTSLTATAIRFAQHTKDQVAIVISTQEQIEYCFMSRAFRELQGLTWLKRKTPLPRRTRTSRFNGDPGRILEAERDEGTTNLHDWFDAGPDVRLLEQIIGLGNYSKTLTVLTLEEAIDEEQVEEESELVRSWTPTLSRSRRR